MGLPVGQRRGQGDDFFPLEPFPPFFMYDHRSTGDLLDSTYPVGAFMRNFNKIRESIALGEAVAD